MQAVKAVVIGADLKNACFGPLASPASATPGGLYTISGRVMATTGPLANVTVTAQRVDDPFALTPSAVTDVVGDFTLQVPANGTYKLIPNREGYRFTPESLTVTVNGGNTGNQDFAAVSVYLIGGAIRSNRQSLGGVTVRTYDGAALAAVTVRIGDNDANYNLWVPSGTYEIIPEKPGYTFIPPSRQVTIGAAHVFGMDFEGRGQWRVSGHASCNGVPLSDVSVRTTEGYDNTSTDGLWELFLPDGTYVLEPRKEGFVFTPSSRTVTVNGGDVAGQDFTTTNGFFVIRGRVSYSGSPVEGAMVTSSPGGSTTTNADGNYFIDSLPNGTYTVSVAKPGYTFCPPSRSVTIQCADAGNQNFSISTGVALSGKVKWNDIGLEGVNLTCAGRITTTDSNGDYYFFPVQNGSYTVTPSKDAFAFYPPSIPVTVDCANAGGLDFSASDLHTLSGAVTCDGAGMPGVLISMNGLAATTSGSGAYSFANLARGTYTIVPSKPGVTFSPPQIVITIADGNPTGQNFSAMAFTLSGTVTIPSGPEAAAPFPGATVSAGGMATTTDALGRYMLASLPNGAYPITVSKEGWLFTPSSGNGTVVLNCAPGTQDFTASPNFSVSGSVRQFSDSGIPMEAVEIAVTGTSTGTRRTWTNNSGNYYMEGLRGDYYTITPSFGGFGFSPPQYTDVEIDEYAPVVNGMDFFGYPLGTYTISGKVLNRLAQGVEGATVSVLGWPLQTQSAADGSYSFANMLNTIQTPDQQPYYLVASKQCIVFEPARLEATVAGADKTNQNFTISRIQICLPCYDALDRDMALCGALQDPDACAKQSRTRFSACLHQATTDASSALYNATLLAVSLTRASGQPEPESVTFTVETEGDYYFNVTNGDQVNKDTMISSATVDLSPGGRVFGPSDLNKNVIFLSKSVHLVPGEYTLTTRLTSQPGAYLTIVASNLNFGELPP